MQLNIVTILALYLLQSNAFGIPKVGSVASQLKEAASQSFLRTRGGQEESPTKTGMVDKVQDVHETEDEEEMKESSSGAVVEHDDMHATKNATDLWEYERENDDGTVLTGANPFENHTMQSLEEIDESGMYEQEEDEIPSEWTDPTNSTDEWAYEKANDDGTVLYGTNPLEASGFIWEQDELTDEEQPHEANSNEQQEANSDEQQDEDAAQPKNQVVLHAGIDSMAQDKQDDEWVTGEEIDDGTVLYGTNPLENLSDDEEEDADDVESSPDREEPEDMKYNPDRALAVTSNSGANSTHNDEEEEEFDDGTLDYGTNPMDTPDDEDEEANDEDAVVGLMNSTQTDNEPEESDDGEVLYGTNPLEPSDDEDSGEQDVTHTSETKALPAPTPSQNVSKEISAQMAV